MVSAVNVPKRMIGTNWEKARALKPQNMATDVRIIGRFSRLNVILRDLI